MCCDFHYDKKSAYVFNPSSGFIGYLEQFNLISFIKKKLAMSCTPWTPNTSHDVWCVIVSAVAPMTEQACPWVRAGDSEMEVQQGLV